MTLDIDYCIAAFGIILIISTFQWVVDGRKNFTGPRMSVDVVPGVVSADEATSSTVEQAKDPEAEHVGK